MKENLIKRQAHPCITTHFSELSTSFWLPTCRDLKHIFLGIAAHLCCVDEAPAGHLLPLPGSFCWPSILLIYLLVTQPRHFLKSWLLEVCNHTRYSQGILLKVSCYQREITSTSNLMVNNQQSPPSPKTQTMLWTFFFFLTDLQMHKNLKLNPTFTLGSLIHDFLLLLDDNTCIKPILSRDHQDWTVAGNLAVPPFRDEALQTQTEWAWCAVDLSRGYFVCFNHGEASSSKQ